MKWFVLGRTPVKGPNSPDSVIPLIPRKRSDEQRPSCLRCVTNGWNCDGYSGQGDKNDADRSAGIRSVHITIRPSANLITLPDVGDQGERRSLRFFCDVIAPRLAYEFDDESNFWTGFVCKVCHQIPSVRHAALAVGGLYEGLVYDTTNSTNNLSEKTAFALKQYNKAISLFREQMNSSDQTELLGALSLCTLFVCLEFLQNKKTEALVHLAQARRLINVLGDSPNLPPHQIDLVRRYIVPIYTRLGLSGSLFGLYMMAIPSRLCDPSSSQSFHSLQQASQTLYLLVDNAMHWRLFYKLSVQCHPRLPTDFSFKSNGGSHVNASQISRERLLLEQQELLIRLSQWDASFAAFLTTLPTESVLAPSALLLQVHSRASSIWVATALAQYETDYDEYLDSFSALVQLCRQYLEATDRTPATASSGGPNNSQPETAKVASAPVIYA